MTRPAPKSPIEPRGLRADDAALYVGVGRTKFLDWVREKRMPAPARIDGVVLWDIRRLDACLDEIFAAVDDPYARVE